MNLMMKLLLKELKYMEILVKKKENIFVMMVHVGKIKMNALYIKDAQI